MKERIDAFFTTTISDDLVKGQVIMVEDVRRFVIAPKDELYLIDIEPIVVGALIEHGYGFIYEAERNRRMNDFIATKASDMKSEEYDCNREYPFPQAPIPNEN